eukprot:3087522-Prymnesium_polylepis.1
MGATSVVFTTFHAYRVGNTLDRKLASAPPTQGSSSCGHIHCEEVCVCHAPSMKTRGSSA